MLVDVENKIKNTIIRDLELSRLLLYYVSIIMNYAGQKYSVVNAHLGRYTLKAKDANGKTVLVVTNVNQLIVPEDKKLVKISFIYKNTEHITWVDAKNLQNSK